MRELALHGAAGADDDGALRVLTLGQRLARLDVATLDVRPPADPVARLDAVARRLDVRRGLVELALATQPTVRAFVVFGHPGAAGLHS